MELPRRARGDERLGPGEFSNLMGRLRRLSRNQELRSVIACAFDHRTRMLPFIFADLRMASAGARAIGSALYESGFPKTRIVLQQWNRNFRPSQMRLDGEIPELFLVSSMQIHSERCKELIRDACQIDPEHRPLIVAGGPKTIYEPWDVFGSDPMDPWGADAAVTGEEFVFLSLLEVLLSTRQTGERLRTTFLRARDTGLLESIPGLVYAQGAREGVAEELVDTGVQRLLSDLDELPHPAHGYGLLELPSRKQNLASRPLPAGDVQKYSPISSLVLTFGCKFNCSYCPIPAYNQKLFRVKSPERIADEMGRIRKEYGIKYFFGTDDNFFNNRKRALGIVETLARSRAHGVQIGSEVRWGTEVTVHDTVQMKDDLKLVRAAGVRALWLGVEDVTATLVRKGQSVDKTIEAFGLLKRHGICPMPMMMHHDGQPLVTWNKPYGLLNQVRLLRSVGAVSLQVLMMTPATGSREYENAFRDRLVFESVAGKAIEPHMLDANYVVASTQDRPWRKQLNIMTAYVYFYNPLRFLYGLIRPRTRAYFYDSGMQLIGMWGAGQTIRRTLGHAFRLMRGKVIRSTGLPVSNIPMRSVIGEASDHALPGTRIAMVTESRAVRRRASG